METEGFLCSLPMKSVFKRKRKEEEKKKKHLGGSLKTSAAVTEYTNAFLSPPANCPSTGHCRIAFSLYRYFPFSLLSPGSEPRPLGPPSGATVAWCAKGRALGRRRKEVTFILSPSQGATAAAADSYDTLCQHRIN